MADDTAIPAAVKGSAACSTLPIRQDPAELPTGDLLPDITLRCLTSAQRIGLRALGGQPTVINIWASWCGPCREEMPMLEAAHDDYGAQVAFVGVNTRDASTIAASFLEELNVSYPQLIDPDAQLLQDTGVPGLPVTLVVAADGSIAGRHLGELDRESLDGLVKAARG